MVYYCMYESVNPFLDFSKKHNMRVWARALHWLGYPILPETSPIRGADRVNANFCFVGDWVRVGITLNVWASGRFVLSFETFGSCSG